MLEDFHFLYKKQTLSPTADLYFLNILQSQEFKNRAKTVKRISKTFFQYGMHYVIARYANERIISTLKANTRPLIYLVDDNFQAIENDPNIPNPYRSKIIKHNKQYLSFLKERASIFVSPNPVIQRHYHNYGESHVLEPYWKVQKSKYSSAPKIRLAWMASRSHLQDLESIRVPLQMLFEKYSSSEIELHTFLGSSLPYWLRSYPHVKNHPFKSWRGYFKSLSHMSFDIGLYPLLPTETNHSRSLNKFFEYNAVHAVCVASDIWYYSHVLEDSQAGVIIHNESEWFDKLDALISSRDLIYFLRKNANILAETMQDVILQEQADFWGRL